MKAIKYLFMGAMLLSGSTSALAQDGTQADIAAVKNLIQSKPADMVKAMKPFYSKNKKNAENLVAFGRAFYEAKDTANARVAANNALNASKRQYSPAYVLLGDIAAMGDDGGEAAAMYEQAIYYDKTNPDPYRKYALVYRKIDPDGAVAKLEQLRSEVPSYPVDALKAHIYYLSLKYGPAIETYAQVPTSQMTRSDFIEYANACFVLQQYEQGYNAAKAGLAKEPNNGTLTRLAMFCANKMKKYDEAVSLADALFTKVHKDSINYSHLDYLNYGDALVGNGQPEQAIEKYKQGLTLKADDSDLADLHKSLSDAYKSLKDFPNAISSYKDYLNTAKEPDAIAYAGLGTLNMNYARSFTEEDQKEQQTAALQETDKVWGDLIEKFPDAAEYGLFQRATVNAMMDPDSKEGLAKPYFEQLIEKITAREERDATDNTRLEKSYRYLMFYYYSIVKDNKMALDYANKILEVKPDDEGITKVVESLSKVVK
ncbi:MAG: hypothetical protein IJ892_04275 [Prevotella sp.]|nr:hypothetical protein [Prevotella sp.]